LSRWSSLSAAEARAALANQEQLDQVQIAGVAHWYDATTVVAPRPRPAPAFLLPVYDGAVLTYPKVRFSAVADHPDAKRDPFWAPIIVRRRNLGLWKRVLTKDAVTVTTRLAPSTTTSERRAVAEAAQGLADFLERQLVYVSEG
jgi:hypothetical protein